MKELSEPQTNLQGISGVWNGWGLWNCVFSGSEIWQHRSLSLQNVKDSPADFGL